MKKGMLAIFIVVMFSGVSFSADLEGFMGIPWGASKAEFSKVLTASGGVIDRQSKDHMVAVSGVRFAGMDTNAIVGTFIEGKLCKVDVFDVPDKDFEVIDLYNTWKKKIAGKYGTPSNDYAYFESPYEEGDGYAVQAIRQGKGKFAAFWFFKPEKTGDAISIQIASDLFVVVSYEDDELFDLHLARVKAEAQKDL